MPDQIPLSELTWHASVYNGNHFWTENGRLNLKTLRKSPSTTSTDLQCDRHGQEQLQIVCNSGAFKLMCCVGSPNAWCPAGLCDDIRFKHRSVCLRVCVDLLQFPGSALSKFEDHKGGSETCLRLWSSWQSPSSLWIHFICLHASPERESPKDDCPNFRFDSSSWSPPYSETCAYICSLLLTAPTEPAHTCVQFEKLPDFSYRTSQLAHQKLERSQCHAPQQDNNDILQVQTTCKRQQSRIKMRDQQSTALPWLWNFMGLDENSSNSPPPQQSGRGCKNQQALSCACR